MPRPRRKGKEKENDAPPVRGHSVVANGDRDRDRVAQRAYELYLARGGADGRDMDDWLIAEVEIRARADREPDES